MKLTINSAISSIDWPPAIRDFFKSQPQIINLGSIYIANVVFRKKKGKYKYVNRQLIGYSHFLNIFYPIISRRLQDVGLPSLADSIRICREIDNATHRAYLENSEGGSSG